MYMQPLHAEPFEWSGLTFSIFFLHALGSTVYAVTYLMKVFPQMLLGILPLAQHHLGALFSSCTSQTHHQVHWKQNLISQTLLCKNAICIHRRWVNTYVFTSLTCVPSPRHVMCGAVHTCMYLYVYISVHYYMYTTCCAGKDTLWP